MHRLLRRTLFAGSAALAGAVLWGAQSASADGGGTDQPDQVQEVVVDNSTTQDASAAVSSGQVEHVGTGLGRRRWRRVRHAVELGGQLR